MPTRSFNVPGFAIQEGDTTLPTRTVNIDWDLVTFVLTFSSFPADAIMEFFVEREHGDGVWHLVGHSVTGPGLGLGNTFTATFSVFPAPYRSGQIRARFKSTRPLTVSGATIEASR